jgi:RNA polymerase sigma-70 factor (ECF subfamily)
LDDRPAADGQSRAAPPGVASALLAHLDAAHNLAHWLTGNDHDAQEIAQEAYLRAIRSAGTFRGGDERSWLLSIVRNLSFDFLRRNKVVRMNALPENASFAEPDESANPAAILQRSENIDLVRAAIASLDPEFREAIVLREMEGMSYKEIADLAGVPIGTVMSRLARARRNLARALSQEQDLKREENPA